MRVLSSINSRTAFIQLGDSLVEQVKAEALEYMKRTEGVVMSRVPVDTGILKNNTGATMSDSGSKIVIEFKSASPYAAYQEFGTLRNVDTGYIATHGLDRFAKQFKSKNKTKSKLIGNPAKRYFFGPIRFWTVDFVLKLKKLGFR